MKVWTPKVLDLGPRFQEAYRTQKTGKKRNLISLFDHSQSVDYGVSQYIGFAAQKGTAPPLTSRD
ncbi:hypothetical protein NQ318_017011 [Aromia moschata]|uniref:Uncharacterized protein n=1 Tax=Aromia moschata TaxID=1265417 RepID=A0AAV8XW84_9CUCU|nr:hypothetical protein NQ318_017011 [Aromia moschata]